jgi:hypothetical protein
MKLEVIFRFTLSDSTSYDVICVKKLRKIMNISRLAVSGMSRLMQLAF